MFSFLLFFPLCSVSSAPYRSRSVVNLHHQDTETDEATMVLPPADYSDTPQHNATQKNTSSTSTITTNNNHQHSPTPSAASSSSADQNKVGVQAGDLVPESPERFDRLLPNLSLLLAQSGVTPW